MKGTVRNDVFDILTEMSADTDRNQKAANALLVMQDLSGRKGLIDMAHGAAPDCDFFNDFFSKIYVGKNCMNPDRNLVTPENWQEKLAAFAELMQADCADPTHVPEEPVSFVRGTRLQAVHYDLSEKNPNRDLFAAREKNVQKNLDKYDLSEDFADHFTRLGGAYHPDIMAGATGQENNDAATDKINEELDWALLPYDDMGNFRPEKVGNTLRALARTEAQEMLALGRETQRIYGELRDRGEKDAYGNLMDDDEKAKKKAASVAFLYSEPGLKCFGIQQAVATAGMRNGMGEFSPIMEKIAEAEGNDKIKTGLNSYFHSLFVEERDKFKATLSAEDQKIFDLGAYAQEKQGGGHTYSPSQQGFIEEYAREPLVHRSEVLKNEMQNDRKYFSRSVDSLKQDVAGISELGNAFAGTSAWYHGNTEKFDALVKATERFNRKTAGIRDVTSLYNDDGSINQEPLETVSEEKERLADAAADYLSSKWKGRKTSIGKERFDKAMDLLIALDPDRAENLRNELNKKREINGKRTQISFSDLQTDMIGKKEQKARKDLGAQYGKKPAPDRKKEAGPQK